MTKVLSIIFALLIFEVIIVIHEFGHFIVARWNGVKVNEFAIGMGPAIFKKQGRQTLFALRAFPIGGYCAMEGED
ncbi:MAG: site-2 protease family protein, partial [Ruminococcus sp.]|nr:site-2 protease family protein [Ruminococcus sp.]